MTTLAGRQNAWTRTAQSPEEDSPSPSHTSNRKRKDAVQHAAHQMHHAEGDGVRRVQAHTNNNRNPPVKQLYPYVYLQSERKAQTICTGMQDQQHWSISKGHGAYALKDPRQQYIVKQPSRARGIQMHGVRQVSNTNVIVQNQSE